MPVTMLHHKLSASLAVAVCQSLFTYSQMGSRAISSFHALVGLLQANCCCQMSSHDLCLLCCFCSWVLAFHVAFLGVAQDLQFPASKAMPATPKLAAEWISNWITQPILNGDLGVDVFFTRKQQILAKQLQGGEQAHVPHAVGLQCQQQFHAVSGKHPALGQCERCICCGEGTPAVHNPHPYFGVHMAIAVI